MKPFDGFILKFGLSGLSWDQDQEQPQRPVQDSLYRTEAMMRTLTSRMSGHSRQKQEASKKEVSKSGSVTES